jgi:hypothetical protein
MRAGLLSIVVSVGALVLMPAPNLGIDSTAQSVTAVPGVAPATAVLPTSMADGTMTVSAPRGLELDADVLVRVPITVVCKDPAGATGFQDFIAVPIEQAHANTVSHGNGSVIDGAGDPLVLICDGTTVNSLTINVLADTASSPFKNGAAVMTVSVSRFESGGTYGAVNGPMVIQLRA